MRWLLRELYLLVTAGPDLYVSARRVGMSRRKAIRVAIFPRSTPL